MASAIETTSITKRFGEIEALAGVSVSIPVGESFGLLGPNGAGKTTLIRILTTLIRPTSGQARVGGFDVVSNAARVRGVIGVVPQAMTSDLDLTARETMDIYARFFDMPRRERKERIDELLALVGLRERANDLVATYSGGMRRRLEIARGLVHRPSVLILDEPTIGLDPQSRHVVWELLEKFRSNDGLTILLTTHYMDEAEALCDRVAIIDYGRIVALDTVEGLKRQIPEKDTVDLTLGIHAPEKTLALLKSLPHVTACSADGTSVRVSVDNGAEAIPRIVDALKGIGVNVLQVLLKQQTLEDVFIHFTGRPIREEEARKVSFLLGAGIPTKWGR